MTAAVTGHRRSPRWIGCWDRCAATGSRRCPRPWACRPLPSPRSWMWSPAGRCGGHSGKPAALNTGIAAARGELMVLVDGDTVLEAQAVARLVQPFTDPDVGAVSGNTKVANRRTLLGRWRHLEYVMGFNLDRRMFDIAQ